MAGRGALDWMKGGGGGGVSANRCIRQINTAGQSGDQWEERKITDLVGDGKQCWIYQSSQHSQSASSKQIMHTGEI